MLNPPLTVHVIRPAKRMNVLRSFLTTNRRLAGLLPLDAFHAAHCFGFSCILIVLRIWFVLQDHSIVDVRLSGQDSKRLRLLLC